MAQDDGQRRSDGILARLERTAEHRRRAEDIEELGRDRDPGHQPHGRAGRFERDVVGPIRRHAPEAGEVRPEPQELLLGPVPVGPQDAHLLLAHDRQRIQEQRPGDAEDGRRAAAPSASVTMAISAYVGRLMSRRQA
jgi:hypothetical protein